MIEWMYINRERRIIERWCIFLSSDLDHAIQSRTQTQLPNKPEYTCSMHLPTATVLAADEMY